jgi:SAM-dependent methyltransferase
VGLLLILATSTSALAQGGRQDIVDLRLWTGDLFALQERFGTYQDSLPERGKMGMKWIFAYEEGPQFAYVMGSVRSWRRRCIFLKPDVLVVDDAGPLPSGPVVWAVHTRAAPAIKGDLVRFAGPDAKLRCRSILPPNAAITSRPEPYDDYEAPHVVDVGRRTGLETGGRYVHVFTFDGEDDTQVRSSLDDKTGTLGLEITQGDRTFELALPKDAKEAGTIAISSADGKPLLPQRLLPSGIMPHGPKGVALLERWDKPYRGTRVPGWDTGRVATELKKAVEDGTIRPGRALVLGCGSGTNAIFLAEKGFHVTGVDVAPTALTVAEKKAVKAGVRVRWVVADVAAPPDLEPFDVLFDRGCYHHVRGQNAKGYVDMVRHVTKPGGALLLLSFRATDGRRSGLPRIKESEIRGDFADGFDFQWLRAIRFDTRGGPAKGAPAWSALIRRKKDE